MKLKSILAALFFSTFLFTGCDKKDEPTPQPIDEVHEVPQAPNSMTAKVNNIDWAAFIPTSTLQNGDFVLAGSTINGHAIGLYVQGKNITQAGTYSAVAVYMEVPQDSTNGPTWVNPAASITISKLDSATKKVSGTFSFNAFANPMSGATGFKNVTNGVFNEVTLQ